MQREEEPLPSQTSVLCVRGRQMRVEAGRGAVCGTWFLGPERQENPGFNSQPMPSSLLLAAYDITYMGSKENGTNKLIYNT